MSEPSAHWNGVMNTSPHAPTPWWSTALSFLGRTLTQLGRDLGYLLVQLPISIATFTVAVTLFSLALGTAVIWVGVPLGALTLVVASWGAALERKRLAAVGAKPPVASYTVPAADAPPIRRLLHPFTDARRWKDLAYAIVDFPFGVFVWSVGFSWTALALSGPTVWFWDRFVPRDSEQSNVEILNWLNSVAGQTTIGLFALVTLPVVARGLVLLQQGVGAVLLSGTTAQQLRAEVSRMQSQGKAAASAEADSLRRIERDLHDGPQQRLIRVAMDVQQAEAALETDPKTAKLALESAKLQSAQALAELRQLTRGIAPPILVERGLVAAIESLAERGTVEVQVDAGLDQALSTGAQTALYFVASETLANVEKHAQASRATITLRTSGGTVVTAVLPCG